MTVGSGDYAYTTYYKATNLVASPETPIVFKTIVVPGGVEKGGSINNPNPQASLWKNYGSAHVFIDKIDKEHLVYSWKMSGTDVWTSRDPIDWERWGKEISLPYEKLKKFGGGQHKLYIAYTAKADLTRPDALVARQRWVDTGKWQKYGELIPKSILRAEGDNWNYEYYWLNYNQFVEFQFPEPAIDVIEGKIYLYFRPDGYLPIYITPEITPPGPTPPKPEFNILPILMLSGAILLGLG